MNRVVTIQETAAEAFGLRAEDVRGYNLKRRYVVPRDVAVWLCRQLTACTCIELGRAFGNRSHTWVINSTARMERRIEGGHKSTIVAQELLQQLRETIPGPPLQARRRTTDRRARLRQVLAYVQSDPGCTTNDVAEAVGISRSLAWQDLRSIPGQVYGCKPLIRAFGPGLRWWPVEEVDRPQLPHNREELAAHG